MNRGEKAIVEKILERGFRISYFDRINGGEIMVGVEEIEEILEKEDDELDMEEYNCTKEELDAYKPGSPNTYIQCQGTNQNGSRCKNTVPYFNTFETFLEDYRNGNILCKRHKIQSDPLMKSALRAVHKVK